MGISRTQAYRRGMLDGTAWPDACSFDANHNPLQFFDAKFKCPTSGEDWEPQWRRRSDGRTQEQAFRDLTRKLGHDPDLVRPTMIDSADCREFLQMIANDLDKLAVYSKKGTCIARPEMCVFRYSSEAIHDLGGAVADVIEAYFQVIGADVLDINLARNGTRKPLNKRQVDRDINELKDFPDGLSGMLVEYKSGNDGGVGEYAICFYGTDFKKYEWESHSDNLLRLDFPADFINSVGLDRFVDITVQFADIFPFQSGNVGYALKRTTGTAQRATRPVNRLIQRFFGFDPCYQWMSSDGANERSRTPSAHWINLVDETLAERLGGVGRLRQLLPSADVRELRRGVFIRGAKMPPIGDINRRALDIGYLPDVARALKPTRVELSGLGEPVFDAMRWLARFDEMEFATGSRDNARAGLFETVAVKREQPELLEFALNSKRLNGMRKNF